MQIKLNFCNGRLFLLLIVHMRDGTLQTRLELHARK